MFELLLAIGEPSLKRRVAIYFSYVTMFFLTVAYFIAVSYALVIGDLNLLGALFGLAAIFVGTVHYRPLFQR